MDDERNVNVLENAYLTVANLKPSDESDILDNPNNLNDIGKLYFCGICRSRYEFEDELKQHVSYHQETENDSFVCGICDALFSNSCFNCESI